MCVKFILDYCVEYLTEESQLFLSLSPGAFPTKVYKFANCAVTSTIISKRLFEARRCYGGLKRVTTYRYRGYRMQRPLRRLTRTLAASTHANAKLRAVKLLRERAAITRAGIMNRGAGG